MNVILTTYQGAFLGPIAKFLGYILEGIYTVLSQIGIENTGICLIIFTFIVNGLMIPLQIKQQKFSKMSSIMNPEIQAIQQKYKGKKDQESQQKMSIETQEIYKKYGVSPASGCLPMLITLPILFALYRVIYNVPAYVGQVYDIYEGIANQLIDLNVSVKELAKYATSNTYIITDAVKNATGENADKISYYIDVIGQYGSEAWDKLAVKYPTLKEEIAVVSAKSSEINYFLGLNIADTPGLKSFSVIIPILSVVTQFISTKLSMAGNPQATDPENPTAASMKMMNNVMPFITGAMCFMFPIGVGIYWVTGNVFRILQQIGINIYFDHTDMNAIIEKNIEKNKERMEKMGVKTNGNTATLANQNLKKKDYTKKEDNSKDTVKASSIASKSTKNTDFERAANKKYKPGSIASYANMLNRDDSKK